MQKSTILLIEDSRDDEVLTQRALKKARILNELQVARDGAEGLLTSSREERDLLEGYKGGANSYIVKPVDIAQFEESIRQLGLYWLVLNEVLR